jgi:hypothetical protein
MMVQYAALADAMHGHLQYTKHKSTSAYLVMFIDCVRASLLEYGLKLLSLRLGGGPE